MDGEPFAELAPYYDLVMAEVPYREWVDYVELLVRHWSGSSEHTLDLACGTASAGVELARRGSRVVGVDRIRPMLEVGLTKARKLGLELNLVRQDMRRLGFSAAFNLVVCLFDSINYVLSVSELRGVCDGVRAALRPGGLFVFDVNTEMALAEELFTQEELAEDAPMRLRWRSAYDKRTRTTTVRMEFYLDDGRVLTEVHRERAYSPRELRDVLAAAGFTTLAVYDAYTFNLPRRDSDRVFYVCRAAS